MKKALSVAALVVGLTGSALAADLPSYKAPPPPPLPPPPLWTGFYVGLNAGGTWSSSRNTTISTFPIPAAIDLVGGTAAAALSSSGILSTNSSGFIGGGQVGYNWQFMNSFVAGVEADIQGVAASNSAATGFGIAPVTGAPGFTSVSFLNATRQLDYVGTVRGRLGWLFTPTLLVYGTGGLAYGGVRSNISTFQTFLPLTSGVNPAFGAGQFSDTRVGWSAGGGLEWMVMPHWSVKAEYLYYDLGTLSYAASPAALTTAVGGVLFGTNLSQVSTRFNGNIVRAGVNYHFNWGVPPIVAKY
jgi:outer membrane immunogenic protein